VHRSSGWPALRKRAQDPVAGCGMPDGETLGLETLHARLSDAFAHLACLVGAAEDAVGSFVADSRETASAPIVALQGLDRVRQCLEDYRRLSQQVASEIAAASGDSGPRISVAGLRAALVLQDNAARLIRGAVPWDGGDAGVRVDAADSDRMADGNDGDFWL